MINFRLSAKYTAGGDSSWHFVAFAWDSSSGRYSVWLDSDTSTANGVFRSINITEGGKIFIGEKRTTNSKAANYTFIGQMACIQMWPISLTAANVTEIYNKKRSEDGACQTAHDPLLTWAQVKAATATGKVTLVSPSELRPWAG